MAASGYVVTMLPEVRQLYKSLIWTLHRDYPDRSAVDRLRESLKQAFFANRLATGDRMVAALRHGEYVLKELEALVFLARYRELKRRYPEE